MSRIAGAFTFKCSRCGGRVRLLKSITEPTPVRQMLLEHVGEPATAPVVAPALEMDYSGGLLWKQCLRQSLS